jgi:hypothetical protein
MIASGFLVPLSPWQDDLARGNLTDSLASDNGLELEPTNTYYWLR